MKKVIKKILWILAVTGVISCVGMSHSKPVSAAVVSDSSSDNTTATANNITVGDTVSGEITETDDLDFYKFTLNSAGCVTLNMTSYMQYYCIIVYDSYGEEIWYTNHNEWNSNVGYRRDAYDLYLENGTYYMQINGYSYGAEYKSTGRYECSTRFLSSGVNNVESDNSFAEANNVSLGNTLIGQISCNDDLDIFKFGLSHSGCVTLDMTSYMRYYRIIVYDSDGKEIWYTNYNEWTESVGYRQDIYNLYFEKGNYYMQVDGYKYGSEYKSTGKYVIDTKFQSSDVSFEQDNNSFATANSVLWNTEYIGQISENDDYDTYKFQVSPSKTVVVKIASFMKYYCIKIFNAAGEEIWYTDFNEWTESVGYRADMHNIALGAGTYYMQINGYKYSSEYKSTGQYAFKIEDLNRKNCIHNYTDNTVYPTYFAKGYDFHKCKKCGYSYKDKYTDKKKLGQSYFYSDCYTVKAKLYLSWSVVSDASGYQIRYSLNKKFKSGVITKTIKGQANNKKTISKLKRKKKYYVQVRAYKKSGTKTVYGKWSTKGVLKTN